MLGLPPDLTYAEYVALALNLDTIRWLQVDTVVQAIRIADSQVPPVAYLQAVHGDKDRAADHMGGLLLTRMMKCVGRH